MQGTAGGSAAEARIVGFGLMQENVNGRSTEQLVIQLTSNGVPEWSVAYSDRTRSDGSPVDIAGDGYLRVTFRTEAPGGRGSSSTASGSGTIAEARTLGWRAGQEEVLIGLRGGRVPFQARALTDPGRIVIDIPGAS